ncbi:MAG: hypothetical protein GIW95_05535 [Candidatus Eremiobacteraeota bacterium]|nr:hypothetical protein [Candidatus Eremiobacteraeota bacterium]
MPGAYAIFEGDFGGQLYAVVPVSSIRCDEAMLQALLAALDRLQRDDPSSAGLSFETFAPGDAIAGGMGGAVASPTLWLHEALRARAIRSAVAAVVADRGALRALARLDAERR